jgi:hypothetical protein
MSSAAKQAWIRRGCAYWQVQECGSLEEAVGRTICLSGFRIEGVVIAVPLRRLFFL